MISDSPEFGIFLCILWGALDLSISEGYSLSAAENSNFKTRSLEVIFYDNT